MLHKLKYNNFKNTIMSFAKVFFATKFRTSKENKATSLQYDVNFHKVSKVVHHVGSVVCGVSEWCSVVLSVPVESRRGQPRSILSLLVPAGPVSRRCLHRDPV
jgi:hypothetical protein